MDSLPARDARSTTAIGPVLWSSILGIAVEWYDFLLYALATGLIFNRLFFPVGDPALSSIISFGLSPPPWWREAVARPGRSPAF